MTCLHRKAPFPARSSIAARLALAAHLAGAACLSLAVAACGQDSPLPGHGATGGPAQQPADTSTEAEPASAANALDGGDDAGGDDAGAGIEALAGAWEGAYDAKKGRVGMPAGVKDDRASDDGKAASGPGLVKLTVAPDGAVTGKSEGALGAASVRGKLDTKMLRASFVPDNPLAPGAMTGVLVGIVKGDAIEVEIRVAGPDALVVRQATFTLKKK